MFAERIMVTTLRPRTRHSDAEQPHVEFSETYSTVDDRNAASPYIRTILPEVSYFWYMRSI